MSRHRATPALTMTKIALDVRRQMGDREIVNAALALTVGEDSYIRHLVVAGRPVKLENRGPNARMGRFGGGWDFELGVQMGRNGTAGTIIINLGKGSIRIDPKKAS